VYVGAGVGVADGDGVDVAVGPATVSCGLGGRTCTTPQITAAVASSAAVVPAAISAVRRGPRVLRLRERAAARSAASASRRARMA
jgi:hypothetical protein